MPSLNFIPQYVQCCYHSQLAHKGKQPHHHLWARLISSRNINKKCYCQAVLLPPPPPSIHLRHLIIQCSLSDKAALAHTNPVKDTAARWFTSLPRSHPRLLLVSQLNVCLRTGDSSQTDRAAAEIKPFFSFLTNSVKGTIIGLQSFQALSWTYNYNTWESCVCQNKYVLLQK